MCTISYIADDWSRRNADKIGQIITTTGTHPEKTVYFEMAVSRMEFEKFKDEMRSELESFKKLLIAAKLYDTESGQTDCEDEAKIALFKQLALLLKVDISDIFTSK